jgi:acetoin utilization deacetylase AcuC-like enzyme
MTLALSRRTFLQQASGTLLSVGRGLLPAAAQSPATQVFYDPATLRHEPGSDHPESPKRIDAVMEAVDARAGGRLSGTPATCSREEVLLVHSPQYVKLVRSETGGAADAQHGRHGGLFRILCARWRRRHRRVSSRRGVERSRLQCVLCRAAAGASCVAGPWHGLCIFNNVAIGARYARRYGSSGS